MKKFLALFVMVACLGTMVTAQTAKTCTKSKAACTKSKATCNKSKVADAELPSCPVKAAAKLASMDESIESKTCAASGKTTYYQKSVCPTSGKVSMKEVHYCQKSRKFVNTAPSNQAKAVQASNKDNALQGAVKKKSCAKSCSKSKAACTKSKAACKKSKAACTKSEKAQVKQVKLEENK